MPSSTAFILATPERRSRWRGESVALVSVCGMALICALLVMAWTAINPIIEQVARIEHSRLPRLEAIEKIKYADLEASLAIRNALLIRDERLSRVEIQRYQALDALASSTLESLATSTQRPDGIELLRAVFRSRQALDATRKRAALFDQQGGGSDAQVDALTVDLQSALEAYLQALQRVYDDQGQRVTTLVDAMAQQADRARWSLVSAAAAAGFTMLLLAMLWRARVRRQVAESDRQIHTLKLQRDALVREVHHRIKNHLQGLLGLFEGYRAQPPIAAHERMLATLHGHVLALVGIHGLQARQLEEQLPLAQLVAQQVELIRAGFPGVQLQLSQRGDRVLAAEQTVPIALVITELIVNAIKHGAPAPIQVSVDASEQRARVRITNRLAGPTSLWWQSQTGLGTGLSLVATLIEGIAHIEQSGTDMDLTMTLDLHPASNRAA